MVVEFNGKEVELSSNLPPIVGVTKINTSVPVKIIRNGKTVTLSVTIGELPAEEDLKLAGDGGPKKMSDNRLAVVVTDLTDDQREKLDIKKGGVIVDRIEDGPAAKAGVRQGDIILMVNNEDIKNASHFKDLVKDLPAGKSVPILIQRRGGPVFLALKVENEDQEKD